MPDLSITVFFIPANYTHTPPQPHSHQLIAHIGWRKLASEPRATFFGCGHPRQLIFNSNSLQFPLWSQTNTHYPVVTQHVTLYEKRKKFSKKEKKNTELASDPDVSRTKALCWFFELDRLGACINFSHHQRAIMFSKKQNCLFKPCFKNLLFIIKAFTCLLDKLMPCLTQ